MVLNLYFTSRSIDHTKPHLEVIGKMIYHLRMLDFEVGRVNNRMSCFLFCLIKLLIYAS